MKILKEILFKTGDIEASGTLSKPQNSRRCREYWRKTRRREAVGMERGLWIIRAQRKPYKGYVRVLAFHKRLYDQKRKR